jgi:ubiquinone/menaquinone biosynthesis C-methylase UbiE
VLDLGSGSGTDSFAAVVLVGPDGHVTGIDMTEAQIAKAERLRAGASNVTFLPGRLEQLPLPDGSVDDVISNGVINLCPDKSQVFREIARVLVPGGRMAIADIVAAKQLPVAVTRNADLWAACIGGAATEADYRGAIEQAGLTITAQHDVPQYQFLTAQARAASAGYGVHAVTLAAQRQAWRAPHVEEAGNRSAAGLSNPESANDRSGLTSNFPANGVTRDPSQTT